MENNDYNQLSRIITPAAQCYLLLVYLPYKKQSKRLLKVTISPAHASTLPRHICWYGLLVKFDF